MPTSLTAGLTADTTLMDLLKRGCAVEFPNGARLRGNPRHGDIDLRDGMGHLAGCYGLNAEGLALALVDPGLFPQKRNQG